MPDQKALLLLPMAGLHFTDEVLQEIEKRRIDIKKVTLHVGAGTFKPVSSKTIRTHEMHTEKILVSLNTIRKIRDKLNFQITVVGTTTMRTIESLYWHGVKLIVDKSNSDSVDINQWDPYRQKYLQPISAKEALEKIINTMEEKGQDVISGQTQLMIVPGYRFHIPDVLVTNFHMPKSTLLLLVSAFIGEGWKKAYKYALDNDFRFLSYGDSCLFFKH
ncbi:MAG: S-adenosylmethionine:tRNA ribosyltransferase-isomerase [Bacteroidales bacterium]